MRKLVLLMLALLAIHVAFLIVPSAGSAAPETSVRALPMQMGIVFDVGGRGDKSFNDGAYAGGERARRDLGIATRYVEPGDAPDREAGLRLLAAEGMNIVLGIGFIFSDDLVQLAREYPHTYFAGVDFAVPVDGGGDPVPLPANLAALKFKEEQGSFLVGAIAGLVTKSKKLGFVGGMESPLIEKFEVGYRAGVRQVCPTCMVIVQYAGVTSDAFRDPGRGKELALNQYGNGVDIIYHASGSTGLGVFEAARELNRLAIGVDADQWDEAPGHVLTSMVKHVDQAVFEVASLAKAGRFQGGVHELGLAENGVGYVYDEHNRSLIPDSVHARVEALRARIIRGELAMPSTR